ncbi:MAG: 16S rRNA (cytidine(1402)-2'-O)-methyltransferase [Candidatus Omnitrophota bacterium]
MFSFSMLYIVSTPIGNLKDMTFRAVEVLKSVDLIAAEDTRHTGILLKHYGIDTPQTSYFEHNEAKKADYLTGLMKQGKTVALVSDAGTPGISDPGYRLVEAARREGIPVTVVPGPCAAIAALSLSGFPTDKFCFEGFLPVKSSARRSKIDSWKGKEGTLICYESPYRLLKSLNDIGDVLENPVVCVVREATKKFEEVKKGSAREVFEYFSQKTVKGEIVLLINLKNSDLQSL